MSTCCTVLLIDDSPADRALYRQYLQLDGQSAYTFIEFDRGQAALDWCQHTRPDMILLDYRLPDLDGLQVLAQLQQQQPNTPLPVLMLTGQGDERVAVQAMKSGAQDYLVKGELTPHELRCIVQSVIRQTQLKQQVAKQQEQLAQLNHTLQSLNAELEAKVEERTRVLKANEARLRQQQDALIDLAQHKAFYEGDLQTALHSLTQVAAQSLQVEWVSVWFYSGDRTQLVLQSQYQLTQQQHTQGLTRLVAEAPTYFQALKSAAFLAAEQAQTDYRTQEWLTDWLQPRGITSLLASPISFGGQTIGVLSFEHVGQARSWSVSEENFARYLVHMVSQAMEARDRQQMAVALQQKTKELDRFFSVALDLLCIADTKGYFRRLNRQWEKTLGYPLAQLEGRCFIDFVHPNDLDPTLAAIANLAEQREITSFVNRYRCQDGSYRWLEWHACPVGQTIYAAARDITERKQTEDRIRKSEAALAAAQHVAHVGNWEFDIQTQQIHWSDELFRMFGLPPDQPEPSYTAYLQLIHPDDRAMLEHCVYEAITNGTPYTIDYRAILPDGSIRYHEGRAKVAYNDQRQVTQLFGTALDITERKQAQKTLQHLNEQLEQRVQERTRELLRSQVVLQQSEERLRLALVAAKQGLYDLNLQTGRAIVSPEYATMLGYDPKTFHESNARWMKRLHPDDQDNVLKLYQACVCGDATEYKIEFRQRTKTGEWKWILSLGKIVSWDANGRPLRMLGTNTDITEAKHNEMELKQAKAALMQMNFQLEQRVAERTAELQTAMEAAQAANQAKSIFLANMSHELRTPLNVILGYTQLMHQDPSLSPTHQENLRIMHRSGDHLLSLINDILDLSKIEAGQLSLNETNFDLICLLRNLHEMFREPAIARNLQFQLDLAPQLPQYIATDPNKLRQVLINLLSNAIKFTPTGQVVLRVAVAKGSEPTPAQAPVGLHIEVVDTGVGIAPEELTTIFDAFTQAQAGRKSLQGTGLGLAISQKLVHLLGGELTVASTLGQGSTFQFQIPVWVIEDNSIAPNGDLAFSADTSDTSDTIAIFAPPVSIPLVAPKSLPSVEPDALQTMPSSWIMELYEAALNCDEEAAIALIQQIPGQFSTLAHDLTRLAHAYKFEVLMQLTRPEMLVQSTNNGSEPVVCSTE